MYNVITSNTTIKASLAAKTSQYTIVNWYSFGPGGSKNPRYLKSYT